MDIDRIAEAMNKLRVIPRLIIGVYSGFLIYAWIWVVKWFMHFDWNSLPQDQVVGSVAATAVAGFPAVILGILTRVLQKLIESYWGGQTIKHTPTDAG